MTMMLVSKGLETPGNQIPEVITLPAPEVNAFEGLTFSKMLERFYMNQSPPELRDPNALPLPNLKDRRQC